MAKINFINSVAVDIIRTAYYIRGLELMKLIFAVLDLSLTMGLTRCYKAEGFFTFITVKWRSHKCRVHKGTVDVCEHKGSYPVQNRQLQCIINSS